jgi:hypothetical protein
MINHALTHRLRKIIPCLLVITLVALVGPAVAPVWGGATLSNIPGSACAAYNTNQADRLERSHVRIYNPPSNSQGLWVVCPIVRVGEDIFATANPPGGYINAYFNAQSAANANVVCVVRAFEYDTIHVPGGTASGIIKSLPVTVTRPSTVPSVDYESWEFPNDGTDYNYWSVTCRLAPGTGINSIDVIQW